jgi:uronate dehydrogenase
MKNILITGMSGLIGGLLKKKLEEVGGYKLTALNRTLVDGVNNFQADINNIENIKPAFKDQHTVVHLSAYLENDEWEGNLKTNIIGTYNVFEAAKLTGVKRIIFASSGNAIRGFSDIEPYKSIAEGRYNDVPSNFKKITHEQIRPQKIYGAAKVWGEALARHYSDTYDISIICVRIGAVRPENKPANKHEYSTYLSHNDVSEALYKSIEAPSDLKYDVIFALSNNKWGYRDLKHAKESIGFKPSDSADKYII